MMTKGNHTMSAAPRISFEFFPPQSLEASFRLWDTVQTLAPMQPGFVSVTYGAGGTTRKLTHDAVATIHKNYGLNVAAHLTCVNATSEETLAIADSYAKAGVTEIVALRGDPPKGAGKFTPHPDGFANACELIEALAETGKFHLRVGAYPDPHPEATDDNSDVAWLRKKFEAGANSAITQFFFSPDIFWRFQDRVLDAGLDIPIVPGLMLQPNVNGLQRMSSLCGVAVPDWYISLFEGLDDDPATRDMLTATLVSELAAELHDRGVRHYHLYTLNRAEIANAVARVLGMHKRAVPAAG